MENTINGMQIYLTKHPHKASRIRKEKKEKGQKSISLIDYLNPVAKQLGNSIFIL